MLLRARVCTQSNTVGGGMHRVVWQTTKEEEETTFGNGHLQFSVSLP